MKPVSGKELSQILERSGWALRRIHGSHHIYGMEGCMVRIPVPVHANHTLATGLQHHLVHSAGLTEQGP